MGCNLHLHTEVKIAGQWHHYASMSPDRHYAVFAKMANVRNRDDEVTPIALPRGLPADATTLTRFDAERWDSDGHSHSWLNAAEIAELYRYIDNTLRLQGVHGRGWWCEDNFGYFFGNTWGGFADRPGHPPGIEDVRFVFWFDN